MKIEIWSDVMCPFCYIGKRKFELALEQFEHKNDVEVIWKSFQLNPDMKTNPDKSINQYLSEIKGWSLEQAEQMNQRVTEIAAAVGLEYNLNQAIVANSMNAHRFSHLAKKHQLQNEAEERLFYAYFTEGKNTDDLETLVQLGTDIGMNAEEIRSVLLGNEYSEEVKQDVDEARQLGVSGVPFFVLNRKYAISGAQESPVFLNALKQLWQESVASV